MICLFHEFKKGCKGYNIILSLDFKKVAVQEGLMVLDERHVINLSRHAINVTSSY